MLSVCVRGHRSISVFGNAYHTAVLSFGDGSQVLPLFLLKHASKQKTRQLFSGEAVAVSRVRWGAIHSAITTNQRKSTSPRTLQKLRQVTIIAWRSMLRANYGLGGMQRSFVHFGT